MARNRKRAKERRSRRPPESGSSRPGLATARVPRADAAPDPIEHASSEVDLAEAQLALGRPDLSMDVEADAEGDEEEFEAEAEAAAVHEEARPESPAGSGGAAVAVPATAVPASRAAAGTRLVTFLQGSWRELQRVQWPDRRQVMQATAVVIGFVIVAGLYLALADTVASKIMTFILK